MRLIHLALALLCLAAWASAQFADDYRRAVHTGFDIHRWIGITFSVAIFVRIAYGAIGSPVDRFSAWVPFTRARLQLVKDDILLLCRLKLPMRQSHEGLAGLVQAIGLAAFLVIAATGTSMFFLLEPGSRATGLVRTLKEVHESAELIIPAYLFLHVGAVVMHALFGHHLWREMFFLRKHTG